VPHWDGAGAGRHLAQLGWTIGPVNPASSLLQPTTSIRSGYGPSLTACPPDPRGVAAIPEPGVVQGRLG